MLSWSWTARAAGWTRGVRVMETGKGGKIPGYFCVPWGGSFEERLSSRARLAWFALCRFAAWNGDWSLGRCWPSQASLGRAVGISVRTIQKGLLELESKGFLKREVKYGETCGYELFSQGVGKDFRGGTKNFPTNNTNNNTMNNNSLTGEQAEALFEGFWEQYRRYNPGGRTAARTEFRRAFPPGLELDTARKRQDTLLDLLNAAAESWEENLATGRERFNPSMANWLRKQDLSHG